MQHELYNDFHKVMLCQYQINLSFLISRLIELIDAFHWCDCCQAFSLSTIIKKSNISKIKSYTHHLNQKPTDSSKYYRVPKHFIVQIDTLFFFIL